MYISDSTLTIIVLIMPLVLRVAAGSEPLTRWIIILRLAPVIICPTFTKSEKKRKSDVPGASFSDFQQPWVPSITLIANFAGVNMDVFLFQSENKVFLKHISLKIWCLIHSFKRIGTSGQVDMFAWPSQSVAFSSEPFLKHTALCWACLRRVIVEAAGSVRGQHVLRASEWKICWALVNLLHL